MTVWCASNESEQLDLDGQGGRKFLRVLLNLVMHNYPLLVSGALQLLFRHFSQRQEVLQAFQQVNYCLLLNAKRFSVIFFIFLHHQDLSHSLALFYHCIIFHCFSIIFTHTHVMALDEWRNKGKGSALALRPIRIPRPSANYQPELQDHEHEVSALHSVPICLPPSVCTILYYLVPKQQNARNSPKVLYTWHSALGV